jgi:hypothetical protein
VTFTFAFAEKEIEYEGQKFKFRELSVAENDFCADASRDDKGNIDARRMMRVMIAKSIVDPKITIDDLAEMPNRAYLKFAEIVNDLNSPAEDEEEAKND